LKCRAGVGAFQRVPAMLTVEDVNLILAIVKKARMASLPGSAAMRSITALFPKMTATEVKQIIQARQIELDMDITDADAVRNAFSKILALRDRAAALTDNPAIDVPEAIAFFAKRAQTGDEEAKELLKALDHPFLSEGQ
jgi:hypothetical protein